MSPPLRFPEATPDEVLDDMKPEDADAQVRKMAGNGSPAEKYVRSTFDCMRRHVHTGNRQQLNGCGCSIGFPILLRLQ